MAVTGQSGYNWIPVDEALVRLVYQNRHIVKLPGLTHDMKNTVWKIIAMSLRVRQIANKSPRELEERWYKLRNECVTENPTGKDFIIKAILDGTDGCLCECATVFHLHENAAINN